MNDTEKKLAELEIHRYGSNELLKFEKQMEKYFTREYKRWHGSRKLPEDYGVSTFTGDIAKKETHIESIEHYNKAFNIYQAFLDKEYMAYTMAYYGVTEVSEHIDEDITLLQAQTDKFDLIIERAEIKDGQDILELGCGFGGFSKYLLDQFPNIKITGINPSPVQTDHLKQVMLNNDRFSLVQKYFDEITDRDLPDNSFDRVISIGVLEAVTNLDKLFALISRVLKTGGKTFHHFIVSVDTIPQFLNAESTLMADYFPGGHIWPYQEPLRHDKHLHPSRDWFVNGLNYWKTLDEWHKRFWLNIENLYPHVISSDEVNDWNKYFVLCKTMFSPDDGKSYGIGHYLYTKI